MIQYINGDIFEADAEAMVNTVNCVGIMGRGIALQFKKRFPRNYEFYETACKNHEVAPGKMLVFETGEIVNPRLIINFPTKRHWRGASRLEDIKSGLAALKEEIVRNNIRSIALPPLGCGLGGLDWNIVKKEIEISLQELSDVKIMVFEPGNTPKAAEMTRNRAIPKMTPGRAALIELIKQYLCGLLDPYVTLLEVHKLMYFLQECGEPLRLKFKKAIYGPYADNLRHVLNHVEGYFVSGYADGGDDPRKQLQIVPGAEKDAEESLKKYPDTTARIRKVEELVDGFESSFGLELLATVHWLIIKENIMTLDQIIEHTHSWNEHKKQFSARQIAIAVSRLQSKGWVSNIGGLECHSQTPKNAGLNH